MGMIHFITMNNIPSNPIPIHSLRGTHQQVMLFYSAHQVNCADCVASHAQVQSEAG